MQMPSSHDATAGDICDFFKQTQITQKQPTLASVPHLLWSGMSRLNDQAQQGYQKPLKSEAFHASNRIEYTFGAQKGRNSSGFQKSSGLIHQPANSDAFTKIIHPFPLAFGKQLLESHTYFDERNLQSMQKNLNPTFMKSQAQHQPLNFEVLFSGSSTQLEKSDTSAVGKQANESRPAVLNVANDHVQSMTFCGQNHEIVTQEQPSQSHVSLGGQLYPTNNLHGVFRQQQVLETTQIWQQQIMYQQFIQEMHRQQLILQLEQHSQLSREQRGRLLSAQNQSLSAPPSQKQVHFNKAGAGQRQSPFVRRLYQPQNALGNACWPPEIHPPGAGASWQQASTTALTADSSPFNPCYESTGDDSLILSLDVLSNMQVDRVQDFGFVEKPIADCSILDRQSSYDPNTSPVAFPGVSCDSSGLYDGPQKENLQLSGEFSFSKIMEEACLQSTNGANNLDSFYEDDFQSSSQSVDFSTENLHKWAGVLDHEEENANQFSILASPYENQGLSKSINTYDGLLLGNQAKVSGMLRYPQEVDLAMLRNPQEVDSNSAGAGILSKSSMSQASWSVEVVQNGSPQHVEIVSSMHSGFEGKDCGRNLHIIETQFEPEMMHRPSPVLTSQGVWNNLNLRNDSQLSGSSLHLCTDFIGRQSDDVREPDFKANLRVKSKSETEQRDFESTPLQMQDGVRTKSSFPPFAVSSERLHQTSKGASLHPSNMASNNKLCSFLDREGKLNDCSANQQLLQDASQNGSSLSLSEMDWQDQSQPWGGTLQKGGLHGQIFLPIKEGSYKGSQMEITNGQARVPEDMLPPSMVDSQFQNKKDNFAWANTSQTHFGGLARSSENFQAASRMGRKMIQNKSRGQADASVQGQYFDLTSDLEASEVDSRFKEKMSGTASNVLATNPAHTGQKHFTTQNAMSRDHFDPQLWRRLLMSGSIDDTSGSNQKESSMLSTISLVGSKTDTSQPELQDYKEKQNDGYSYSVFGPFAKLQHRLHSPNISGSTGDLVGSRTDTSQSELQDYKEKQNDGYSYSVFGPCAKLQHRLHSPNISGSTGGSSPSRLSRLSGNRVTPEVSSRGNLHLDEVIQSEIYMWKQSSLDLEQLFSQQNGGKSISGKPLHYAVSPSQSKEKRPPVRTNVAPELKAHGYACGNGPANTPLQADSMIFQGAQDTSNRSLFPTVSRMMLHPLTKPESPENASPLGELNQLSIDSHSKLWSIAAGLKSYVSQNERKHPTSPNHSGLRFGQASHTLPMTKNGIRSLDADNGSLRLGKGDHSHRLSSPCNMPLHGKREMRLAQMDLSSQASTHDVMRMFGSSAMATAPVLTPLIANETSDCSTGPTSTTQFPTAGVSHLAPYMSIGNHQSFGSTSGRGFNSDSTFMGTCSPECSSALESDPVQVKGQDLSLQKNVVASSVNQPGLLNDAKFTKVPNNSNDSFSRQQLAFVPRQKDLSNVTSWNEKSNQLAHDAERHPSENPFAVAQIWHCAANNNTADYSENNEGTHPIAHFPNSPGLMGVLSMQENTSSLSSFPHVVPPEVQTEMLGQAHFSCEADVFQQYVNSKPEHMIQRPDKLDLKVLDTHNAGHTDSFAVKNHHDTIAVSPEKRKNIVSAEAKNSLLNTLTQHDANDPKSPGSSLVAVGKKCSVSASTAAPLNRPPHGQTTFDNQHLVSRSPLISNNSESIAGIHSQIHSLPKSLHESAQKRSHRKVCADGVLPSGNRKRVQNSSLKKKQCATPLNSEFVICGHSWQASAWLEQASESVDGWVITSQDEQKNAIIEGQVNSAFEAISVSGGGKPGEDLKGSLSTLKKTITSLPLKRKKEGGSFLMPWRMMITQPRTSIVTPSGAEQQWATAINHIPDKGDEGLELRDTSIQVTFLAKQRLRLTTQLMQTIVAPVPAELMQRKTMDDHESTTFKIAKHVLGEACRLAGCSSKHSVSPSRSNISNDCKATELASGQQKLFKGTNPTPAVSVKPSDEFKERAQRLEYSLARLGSWPSLLEITTDLDHIDELSITNRLMDEYFDDFITEEMETSLGVKAASAISRGTHNVFPRKYVTVLPFVSNFPEGIQLISL